MPITNTTALPPVTFSTNTDFATASSATTAAPAPTAAEPIDVFESSSVSASSSNTAPRRTALQIHVDFFDRDGDGYITVGETYDSLIKLGFGGIRSWGFALAINGGLGLSTGASWWAPLTINTANIHQGKHDSDTDVYDTAGNFVASKFEALFAKYDVDGDGALSKEEFVTFMDRNRESSGGSLASKAEFELLMEIAGEERYVDGWPTKVLTRETLARFYDGSLLYDIAGEPSPV